MKRIIFLLLAGSLFAASMSAQRGNNLEARKLQLALYAISNLYVDPTNETQLVEDAIVGMLEKLDPHSTYTDPEETKEMTEPLQGNFDGIGIQFNMLTDTLYVIQVIPGGPSEKVGLMAGDRIIMVDDTLIAGVKMKNTDVMKRLRGPKNTEVRVKVLRQGVPDLIEFKITRGKIPMYSLDAAYMADKTTGYIKLNRFAASSADEFKEALKKLRKQGMKNLILDLQGNGGGYLNIAIDLADEFLDKDKLIVYTEGRRRPRTDINALGNGDFRKGKVVFMVNQLSASASEILSGAIQDWDRGVIVGRPSFGKGLVQRQIGLPDGSAVRITVARYHTPSGRVIQRPYEKGNRREYYLDHLRRYDDAVRDSLDAGAPAFRTLRSGRTVYGGGGIRPDILIDPDTTGYSDYYAGLIRRGIVTEFVNDWLDRSRDSLARLYPAFEAFDSGFEPSDELLGALTQLGTQRGVVFDKAGFVASQPILRTQLKALAAQRLFGTGAYFQVVNPRIASAYKRAVEILSDWERQGKPLLNPKK